MIKHAIQYFVVGFVAFLCGGVVAQMSNQSSVSGVFTQNNLQVTGGSITGTTISATPSPLGIQTTTSSFDLQIGSSEAITANRLLSIILFDANRTVKIFGDTIVPVATQNLTFAGPTAPHTITLPDADFTVARTDNSNTFSGAQTVTGFLTVSSGSAAGKAACWNGSRLGNCSTAPDATGSCTCN